MTSFTTRQQDTILLYLLGETVPNSPDKTPAGLLTVVVFLVSMHGPIYEKSIGQAASPAASRYDNAIKTKSFKSPVITAVVVR